MRHFLFVFILVCSVVLFSYSSEALPVTVHTEKTTHINFKEVSTLRYELHDAEQLVASLSESNIEAMNMIAALEEADNHDLTFKKDFNVGKFVLTAYAPYDDRNGINSQGDPSVTASGATTGPGTLAVDPNVIPYGSNVIIIYPDGTKEHGVAEDTGGAINNYRIDVFRYSFDTATAYGKKEAVVIWY